MGYEAVCGGVADTTTGSDGEVKVGLHQDAVSSSLLFSIVTDVVTKEVIGGLSWQLLSADDLVLMVLLGKSKEKVCGVESKSVGQRIEGECCGHKVDGRWKSSVMPMWSLQQGHSS